jgi:hypothetical protein
MLTININLDSLNIDGANFLLTNPDAILMIDYATNNLFTYRQNEELELFSFNDYFQMDNRYNKPFIYFDQDNKNISITLFSARGVS